MVLLKDLFTMLATGEFANISLRKDKSGNLLESEYERVISHLNLGIVELFKRFKLMEDEIILHVTPTISIYEIAPKNVAETINFNTLDYLERPELYDGNLNIIKILQLFDTENNVIKINNRHLTPHIRQIDETTLRISGLTANDKYTVVYQAYPSPIVLDNDFDLEECTLPISPTIVEALLYYIASRVYKPIGANNSTANADKSASYQHDYELACTKIQMYGLDVREDDVPDKFTSQGWV